MKKRFTAAINDCETIPEVRTFSHINFWTTCTILDLSTEDVIKLSLLANTDLFLSILFSKIEREQGSRTKIKIMHDLIWYQNLSYSAKDDLGYI